MAAGQEAFEYVSAPQRRRSSSGWRPWGASTTQGGMLLLAIVVAGLLLLHAAVQPRSFHQQPCMLWSIKDQQGFRIDSRMPARQPAAPRRRLLLVLPAPLANTSRVLQLAASANDARLARMASLLEAHRNAWGAHAIPEARAAYAHALSAATAAEAVAAKHAAATGNFSAQRVLALGAPDQGAIPAASMIAEALSAIQDAAAAKGGKEPVIVPCAAGAAADPTLPYMFPEGKRVMVAANLHNCEGVMPNMLLQLLQLAVAQPADAQAMFVQIYESGSSDQTGEVHCDRPRIWGLEVLGIATCAWLLCCPMCMALERDTAWHDVCGHCMA